MPTKLRKAKQRVREPDEDVFWDLSLGPNPRFPVFEDDDDRRAAWIDYRKFVMTTLCRPGTRPSGWWDYESPQPRNRRIEQCQQLYELGALKDDEMAEVMARWREEWVRSHEDGFFFTTAPSQFVQGAMARRRHYQWAGIPPSLVKQWDAERNSRMSRRRRRNARNENE